MGDLFNLRYDKSIKTIRVNEYNSLYLRNKIASLRMKDKGISQTWLAEKLDKSFSMVNAYACNRIQPNLETLQQIAEILQVDLKELITDKNERE